MTALPGQFLGEPFQRPICEPLIDLTRRWVMRGDPAEFAAFLTAHAPSWIPNSGTGEAGQGPTASPTSAYGVIDMVRAVSLNGVGSPTLVFTVASIGGGETGIRADAQVLPPNAVCVRAGGPASLPGG